MRDVGPLIGQIKSAFKQVYEIEKEKFLVKAQQQIDGRELTDSSRAGMVNKLCHRVIKNINSLSKERGPEEAEKFARSLLADTREIISSGSTIKNRSL